PASDNHNFRGRLYLHLNPGKLNLTAYFNASTQQAPQAKQGSHLRAALLYGTAWCLGYAVSPSTLRNSRISIRVGKTLCSRRRTVQEIAF
ncbi:hypothetical protein FocTR4_00002935, partial [Fusarium oxysporum f. sp. cubense]